MDFDQAVQYMSGLVRFGWKLGNERMEALCERLDMPHLRYKVVHIAGTKGKGSTTALAAAMLREQGFHVGAYFSPYVYDVRERVQVDGQMITRDDFARLVTRIRPHIEALAATELGQVTEFELKTILALLHFAEQKVDVACIEVGIGGRLDATNVVNPAVTVVTTIGLDHTEILGDTLGKIAAEKAGIIKPGAPCITAVANPEALSVIEEVAREREAPLLRVVRAFGREAVQTPGAVSWSVPEGDSQFGTVTIRTPGRTYAEMSVQMGGLYQRENAACAVAAAEIATDAFGKTLGEVAVRAGLSRTALPGRLASLPLPAGPLVVLDGAHNAMAAGALLYAVQGLRQRHAVRGASAARLLLVVGMVGGHDPEGVLAPLAREAEIVYACQPQWKRAQPAAEIARAARHFCADVRQFESVQQAVREALDAADSETLLLVTGSFYTVGECPPEQVYSWWRSLHGGETGDSLVGEAADSREA